MRPIFKKWLSLIAGWAFLLLGVLGLFLPVLQGILFIVIGLVILSSEYVWAHHLLQKAKERFPMVAEASHKAHAFAARFHRHKTPSPPIVEPKSQE